MLSVGLLAMHSCSARANQRHGSLLEAPMFQAGCTWPVKPLPHPAGSQASVVVERAMQG